VLLDRRWRAEFHRRAGPTAAPAGIPEPESQDGPDSALA